MKISIKGFKCSQTFRDAENNKIDLSQNYRYIPMNCPKCKEKVTMLYPALNKCKCGCIIAFCALNDRENRIGVWDVDMLRETIE